MRNFLLSVALVAAPVALFTGGYMALSPAATPALAAAPASALGDMTGFATIVSDVQAIARTGDLAAAAKRITDLETAWDDGEATLRPINPDAWGNVDAEIDHALRALRAGAPDPAKVTDTLTSLQTALANPTGQTGPAGTVQLVSGIATTDAKGRALPCETMLTGFRDKLAGATLSDANRATVATLETKGTERCNADDDARADDFFAQGMALMSN